MMLLCFFIQILCGAWLETPALRQQDSALLARTHYVTSVTDSCALERNYSLLYDPATYTSYWVAYPLCKAHLSTGREDSWAYDPSLPDSLQTSVLKNYMLERFETRHYKSTYYARGHQIPNADRNASPAMQAQTYYSTNLTPQLQNGFNGLIWARLEKGIRDCAQQYGDTLYVVTGASFQLQTPDRVGGDASAISGTAGSSAIPGSDRFVVNRNDGKRIPIPRWYWKAVLKVHRDTLGVPVRATSVAFFLPHEDLKGHQYKEYVIPVDSLESLTGFDFFPALSDSLEVACEARTDWEAFRKFDAVESPSPKKKKK
ncbi:MAG: DNA/RNA non-specific endonuclease [Bacteroidales bacterium]|nr:DNA/RNA non-specific endonuclease [Bacteroidales bacterium]